MSIKIKYSFLILLFSVGFIGNSFTQITDPDKFEESLKNASFKQKFETANSLMEDNLYEFAIKVWLNLVDEQPNNSNVNYKLGLCYLNSSLEQNKALKYLLIAEENISKRYDPFSFTEIHAPIETHFYLGEAYHLNEQFDLALEEFEAFKGEVSKKHRLHEKNELSIIYSNNAKKETAAKKDFLITNIGAPINGKFSDFSPVVTADESALFFTSRRVRTDTNQASNKTVFSSQDGKHYEDVYVSYKNMKTREWGKPELMEFSSPRSNQATMSVSSDGQFLFIYKDDNGDGNIYISEREDVNYGEPVYMGGRNTEVDINTPYWETHASLSTDGKTVYFVSDRPGGLGGRDIYRSVKLPNGQWSKALNLGAPINSAYDEDSPFLHLDGKTLYFSSNGTNSMGGFDIFFTKLDDNGEWAEPLNIGYPLNTVGDDVFFSTSIDGKKGYYSSAHEGGLGEKDIYTIQLDTVVVDKIAILKGYIDPGDESEIPAGIVIWVNDLTEGGDPKRFKPNRRTGSYIFDLTPCHKYSVEYMKMDEVFYETEFKVPCNSELHVINKVITMGGLSLDGEGVSENTTTSDSITTDTTTLDTAIMDNAITDTIVSDTTKIENEAELEKRKEKWKYQMYINDDPYYLDGVAAIMDKDDAEFSELIEKGSFKYRELKSKKDPFFEIEMEDVTLCDKMIVKILDENGDIVRITTRNIRCKISSNEVGLISFQKYYGYNEKGVGAEKDRFKEFIDDVQKIINQKGIVSVEIEGSSSRVPTKSYVSNKSLATYRSNMAKELLLDNLKEVGVDLSKVKIVTINSYVQGPNYTGDFKNGNKYTKFQYIKMKAY